MTMIVKTFNNYDVMYYNENKDFLVERIFAESPAAATAALKNRHPKECITIHDVHLAEGDFIHAGEE